MIPWSDYDDRQEFSIAVCDAAQRHGAELLLLAGFMPILSPVAIDRYPNRIIHTHPPCCLPSPAPAVPAALAHGVKVSGVTVHFVDDEVDHGPIIAQRSVAVEPGDTEETLHVRIQSEEHRLFPLVVKVFAAGRLRVEGRRVIWGGVVTRIPVRRALISVADKSDLVPFVRSLVAAGVEVVSSGGTAGVLEEAGLDILRVADVTGLLRFSEAGSRRCIPPSTAESWPTLPTRIIALIWPTSG